VNHFNFNFVFLSQVIQHNNNNHYRHQILKMSGIFGDEGYGYDSVTEPMIQRLASFEPNQDPRFITNWKISCRVRYLELLDKAKRKYPNDDDMAWYSADDMWHQEIGEYHYHE
jgi:hypothetical protein